MKPDPATIVAGVLAMVATARQQVISADDILRGWSIVGALAGALISSLIVDQDSWRKRIVKFVVSVASGFVFAPSIFYWQDWHIDPDTVMAVAAGTAFLSWGVLLVIMRAVPAFLKRRADILLGGSSEDKP